MLLEELEIEKPIPCGLNVYRCFFFEMRMRPQNTTLYAGGGEGEIGSVRIDGIEVDNRAQHHLDKGARILMATPGGGGYGRAVDRKVAHKLEDEILGYMTEE